MSQFPTQLDSDIDLPQVNDDITEIGAIAINAIRDALFRIEPEIGIGASGTAGSIANRLSVSILPDGTINPSILIGLLSLVQISDAQVSPTAAIQESKLSLTYSTSSLYNLINILGNSVDVLNGFLSLVGVKLEPHIDGTAYNHLLSAIHVDPTVAMLKTSPSSLPTAGTNVVNRNTVNADLLIKDLSDDLLIHEKSDSSANITATSGGTVPPLNYAHVADGVYVNSSTFSTIPQSNTNVQSVFEYIDNSSLLLLGSRVLNLYSNGIPRTARSSSFTADGYGEPLVPPTPAVAYLLNEPPGPMSASPVDSFQNGDDIVLFNPTSQQLTTFNFDAQFAQVQPGDLLTINYGTGISYQFVIDSTKSSISGNIRTYAVRINGKNPVSNAAAIARIDRSTFHRGKYGVLSSARAPNSLGTYESLIVANPKSAVALGNGFNPSEFNSTHYNLYLALLPSGDTSSIILLPPIDVTGNQGATPGSYTLDNIVNTINQTFRAPGFNYRFIAFEYFGQIGIMLADPYNNASFSIVSGTVDGYGNYTATSLSQFPENVVDNFVGIDPLGFGLNGSGIATPPPAIAYGGVAPAAYNPTVLFYPLKRNFFYTNGVERDTLRSDPNILNNSIDAFGDGYWSATILPFPATQVLANRVEVVYQVNLDLSASGLKPGKTIVVQPAFLLTDSRYNYRDYGRFIIKTVSFNNCNTPSAYTNITVYDGVHGVGISPSVTSTNIPVSLYFSDDSVSFSAENVFDTTAVGPFKRFFEIYVDGNGHTSTHERARFLNTGTGISNIGLYRVSPKLRGYTTNNDKEIRLTITSYNEITGVYTGYLARWNPILLVSSNFGPTTTGKKGEVVRFYDETNIDYIDFTIDINSAASSFTNGMADIQLFKSLELDEELMLVSSCQVDDVSKQVSLLKDERQFGNVSEEQFTTSALDYISAPERLLNENGVINGFDNLQSSTNQISFNGGTVLVNGKIVFINESVITIPAVIETLYPAFSTTVNTITWFVCANSKSEIELIASTDYSPSLVGTYGSLDQNRMFYVTNPVSTLTYPVRGTYLNNLLTNFSDVVPLYVATSTVTGTTITTLTVVDAKRYVSNGYSDVTDSFILSQEAQFRSMDSVNTWISQFTKYISYTNTTNNVRGTNVNVRGQITLSMNTTLDFLALTTFQGNDGVFNFGSNTVNLNNNLRFNDLTINASTATITIGNNIQFNNCTLNTSGGTLTGGAIGTNFSLNNCTANLSSVSVVTVGSGASFTNSTVSFGSVILGSNTSFTNSTITFSGSVTVGTNTTFTGCTINISSAVGFTVANNNTLRDCTINYLFDATFATLDGSFSLTNPASPAKACIFSTISSNGLSNLLINNCTFASPYQNRFPFVSLIFSGSTSFAENITITNNKFITSAVNVDDKFAVITLVAPSVAPTKTTGPRLNNCNISGNYCNKNQLILISSPFITTNSLDAICASDTRITNNICGAICVFTKQDLPSRSINSLFQADKSSGVSVSDNTCRLIYTGFADGNIFSSNIATIGIAFVNNSGIYSDALNITKNTCSFVYINFRVQSLTKTTFPPIVVRNNRMIAYDTGYLIAYLNGNTGSVSSFPAILISRGSDS